MFDARVKSWKQVLFDSVPRANIEDPCFEHLRKTFQPIESGSIPDVSTSPAPANPAFATMEPSAPSVAIEASQQVRPSTLSPVEIPSESVNTPFQQGTIIGESSNETKVMEPGQTFVFGDD